jgi:hypothetical protein
MPTMLHVRAVHFLSRICDEDEDSADADYAQRILFSRYGGLDQFEGKIMLLASAQGMDLAKLSWRELGQWLWNHRAALVQILAAILGA